MSEWGERCREDSCGGESDSNGLAAATVEARLALGLLAKSFCVRSFWACEASTPLTSLPRRKSQRRKNDEGKTFVALENDQRNRKPRG